MAELGGSVHSEHEIEEDWDVVDAANEMEQLKVHFEQGGVGASLFLEANGSETDSVTQEYVSSLQARNAAMEARIAELEHELSYADKARVNAEQRNAQLCATNATLAEETHAITDKLSRIKKEMDSIVCEKKNLEQNTVQLESFVEETIVNSQSGYNFLCEARERVTDITRELMGLRNFISGEISGPLVDSEAMGFKGGVLQSVMSDLNVTLSVYKEVFADVSADVRRLKTTSDKAVPILPPAPPSNDQSRRSNKIALSNFHEGDVAMFFPTPKGDFVAFNIGTPHHYLSAESKALIGHDPHFKKVYVLGRIIIKEEKYASETDAPYNLKPGTKYYEISVESIADLFSSSAMRGSDNKLESSEGTAAPAALKYLAPK